MLQSPRTVVVEAELSSEFGALVVTYRKLKIHYEANLALCIFLILMSATFFSRLCFAATMITLIIIIGATLFLPDSSATKYDPILGRTVR